MVSHGAAIGPRPMANGKKVKGRKRHIMTDTLGLLLFAVKRAPGPGDVA